MSNLHASGVCVNHFSAEQDILSSKIREYADALGYYGLSQRFDPVLWDRLALQVKEREAAGYPVDAADLDLFGRIARRIDKKGKCTFAILPDYKPELSCPIQAAELRALQLSARGCLFDTPHGNKGYRSIAYDFISNFGDRLPHQILRHEFVEWCKWSVGFENYDHDREHQEELIVRFQDQFILAWVEADLPIAPAPVIPPPPPLTMEDLLDLAERRRLERDRKEQARLGAEKAEQEKNKLAVYESCEEPVHGFLSSADDDGNVLYLELPCKKYACRGCRRRLLRGWREVLADNLEARTEERPDLYKLEIKRVDWQALMKAAKRQSKKEGLPPPNYYRVRIIGGRFMVVSDHPLPSAEKITPADALAILDKDGPDLDLSLRRPITTSKGWSKIPDKKPPRWTWRGLLGTGHGETMKILDAIRDRNVRYKQGPENLPDGILRWCQGMLPEIGTKEENSAAAAQLYYQLLSDIKCGRIGDDEIAPAVSATG